MAAATMLFFIAFSCLTALPVMTPMIERSFVSISSGLVHVAACGAGRPILLVHQTPRSWDEFREVLPLLGEKYRAIAMDTVGFGDSQPLPTRCWPCLDTAAPPSWAITRALPSRSRWRHPVPTASRRSSFRLVPT